MLLMSDMAPENLAESWDPVGLQIGHRLQSVRRIGVALDATFEIVSESIREGVDFLIVHHPLFLRPMKRLDLESPSGMVVDAAVRNGLSIYAAHTNLDSAVGGLNNALGERIGLKDMSVLGKNIKNEEFLLHAVVPFSVQDRVHSILGEVADGIAWWRGMGEENESCVVRCRLASGRVGGVRTKISSLSADARTDIIPAGEIPGKEGLGRIGRIDRAISLKNFACEVKKALMLSHVRTVGNPEAMLERVALCTGSGGGMIKDAIAMGADVLLTGDIKYHEAMEALEHGLCLVDAGHFGTERMMVDLVAEYLTEALAARQHGNISVMPLISQKDPFCVV
ncbi:Nif3-like dinuclear metal center hexameric protein [Desulfobotulus sp. H1]|uniref:GTP cyclohydrolase 1 type 2 homolog n=1 Tax=Desulfobotulus pelophilus TaxID=2823377 RepID=A0ABT3NCN2_9BACT|nr:Nif3-like dinuclear metal center hexameric protein [Desulfobotulus pelophilus]MCW7755190.1 Nif3-like dinuclear metal center hexameric protein [Desulfobotulus pelophilus]